MFGSVVIDVVIAMALVFFVFSLVTSGLREVVAWLLNTRSKVLWQSVRDLLDDPISHGLRPLREAIAEQEADVAQENAPRVEAAERTLRVARDKETTAEDWAADVDEVLRTLESVLVGPGTLNAGLAETSDRLKGAYAEPGTFASVTAGMWSRGPDSRPRSPVVPTIGSVTAIAQSVHNGIRSFTDAVYDHPTVRQIDKTTAGRKSQLTSLESGDFSGAALDLIQAAGVDRLVDDVHRQAIAALETCCVGVDVRAAVRSSLHDVGGRIVAGTASASVVNAAFDRLHSELVAATGGAGAADAVESALESLHVEVLSLAVNSDPLELIEQGLEALENIGPVRDSVARAAAAVRGAETDAAEQLSEISASVAQWYDGRMDSLTVWYRKRSRLVGFLLAFVVVLGFNVDAVDLPRELWQNEGVRSALVAVAESSDLDIAECAKEDATTTTAAAASPEEVAAAKEAADKELETCVEEVEKVVDELIETGLPVGWVFSTECNGGCTWPFETLWHASGAEDSVLSGLLKIVGWMLAAAALSMGASFWFDVMRRAMGIKSSMKGNKDE